MAIQTIDKLKSWFVTLAKPTQQQFWDWLDSYRHVNTKITSNDLDAQLLQLLNNIPNRDALDQLIREFQEYNASLKALAFKDAADWNTDIQSKPTRLSEFENDLGFEVLLDEHLDDKDNPHEVTAAQVGLGNVDNTSDADKPVSNAVWHALNQQEQERINFEHVLSSRIDTNTANIEMLNNITTIRGSINSFAELQRINIAQENIHAGDSYIVLKDESWGGNASIYVHNTNGWIWVGQWTTQIQPADGDTLGTVQDSNDIKWSGGKGTVPGKQPLENQRLGTADNVTHNSLTTTYSGSLSKVVCNEQTIMSQTNDGNFAAGLHFSGLSIANNASKVRGGLNATQLFFSDFSSGITKQLSLMPASISSDETITIPAKSGTIALLGDLSNYQAKENQRLSTTNDVVFRNGKFSNYLTVNSNTGFSTDVYPGNILAYNSSSQTNIGTSGVSIQDFFNNRSVDIFSNGIAFTPSSSSTAYGSLYTNSLSGVRNWNMPDKSGTVAMTSDVPELFVSPSKLTYGSLQADFVMNNLNLDLVNTGDTLLTSEIDVFGRIYSSYTYGNRTVNVYIDGTVVAQISMNASGAPLWRMFKIELLQDASNNKMFYVSVTGLNAVQIAYTVTINSATPTITIFNTSVDGNTVNVAYKVSQKRFGSTF